MNINLSILFIWILPAMVVFAGIYLAYKTEIIRDARSHPGADFRKTPFSFARTQLLWWSLIIIPCFCAYFGLNGKVFEIAKEDYTYLVLMGISLGTVTAAKIIDNTDISNRNERHQDMNNSRGFLIDVVSDENGISVHRFQALVFNLIFGLMFISHFVRDGELLELGAQELALLGLSSATYIGMKINENGKGHSAAAPVQAEALADEDLADIDESWSEIENNQMG